MRTEQAQLTREEMQERLRELLERHASLHRRATELTSTSYRARAEAHLAVDEMVERARAEAARLLDGTVAAAARRDELPLPIGLADALSISGAGTAKKLHDAIDAADVYPAETVEEAAERIAGDRAEAVRLREQADELVAEVERLRREITRAAPERQQPAPSAEADYCRSCGSNVAIAGHFENCPANTNGGEL